MYKAVKQWRGIDSEGHVFYRDTKREITRREDIVGEPVEVFAVVFGVPGDETVIADCYSRKNANEVRDALNAAPVLKACVADFVESWGKDVETDKDIQGSDAVEWISDATPDFQAALAKARGVK